MLKLFIALAAFLLLSGCSAKSDLDLPSAEQFCQQLRQEYPCVDKISIREWPWGVDCSLTLQDADEADAQQLLELCQEFLAGHEFLEEYVPSPVQEEQMPDLSVLIDIDGDGVTDLESSARFLLEGEEEPDFYRTWTDPSEPESSSSAS